MVLNTWVLSMDGTITNPSALSAFDQMNLTFTIVFSVEMGLKLIAYSPIGYVRDPMNLFDGAIVCISLVEILFLSQGNSAISAFRSVRIFRTFRVLRVTKLLRSLAFMKVIIGVIQRSLQSFIYIALLLFLFIFIYALLGRQIYDGKLTFPADDINLFRSNWDTIPKSMTTSFQIMSIENWNGILQQVLRSGVNKFVSMIYLISWIFLGNFSLLNLFMAILLNGFTSDEAEQDLEEAENQIETADPKAEELQQTIKKLSEERSDKAQPDNARARQPAEPESFCISDIEEHIEHHETKDSDSVRLSRLYKSLGCYQSLVLFKKESRVRFLIFRFIKWNHFEHIILVIIICSSIKLAIDTYIDDQTDPQLVNISNNLDIGFNAAFLLESILKIIAYGFAVEDQTYLTGNRRNTQYLA